MKNNKTTGNEEKKGPERKAKVGRFQVSIWKREKVIAPREEQKGYVPERRVDIVRACVQYSRRNRQTGEWVNQSIWCDPHELRELMNCLDELNNLEGDDSPSDDTDEADSAEQVGEPQ